MKLGRLGSVLLVLFAAAPAWAVSLEHAEQDDQTPSWHTVKPIFQKHCVNCHGGERQKSRYRLDTYASLLKPGSSGIDPIVAEEPAQSFLLELMLHHESNDMVMPPEGKPRPSAQEVLEVAHWISLGAEGPRVDHAEQAIRTEVIQTLAGAGLVVTRIALDEPGYLVEGLNLRKPLPDHAWAALAVLQTQIVELNLPRQKLDAKRLRLLDRADALARVNLTDAIGMDGAVAWLNQLPVLQRLNVYGSDLSDAGIAEFDLRALAEFYVGETNVTDGALQAFTKANPKLLVMGGVDFQSVDRITAQVGEPASAGE